jgi:crossover junction endodeoxyribonuclease RuvC
MYLGVDPGTTGALVVLEPNGEFVDALLMPTVASGKSNRVNGAAIAAFLAQYPIIHAFFEKVGAMPGNGGTSMFTFGHAAGLVEGVILGGQIPFTHITPQAWKKAAKLIGSEKDAARSRAVQLYPRLRILDQKIKGQAYADALLIARAGCGLSI